MPPPETLNARLTVLRRARPSDAQSLYLSARNADVGNHRANAVTAELATKTTPARRGRYNVVK